MLEITEADIAAFKADFQIEAVAFEQQLPELLKQFNGEYVAIFQGKVIGHNRNWDALVRLVQQDFPYKFVLIEQVVPKSPSVVCMDTMSR